MSRRGHGEGTFTETKTGLIAHKMSLGFDTTGRRIRLVVYGKTKTECRTKMAAKLEEVRKAGGVPLPDDTTVATWLAAWLQRKRGLAENTWNGYEVAVRKHIEPHLGRMRLDRLRVRDVEAWLDALARAGVGGRARQHARMTLGNSLNDALRLEMIQRNVVEIVPAPLHAKADIVVWDIEEALRFIAAGAACRYSAFWVLWLTVGARPNELLGLRPQDVDLVRGEIAIVKQRSSANDRKRLKTESSRRTLALTPRATEALMLHRERMLAEGLRASPWFFPRPGGGATVYRTLIRDHYEVLIARAGVQRIRPYDLRHTYATLALKAGVPVKVVSETLGHASIKITLDTYAHVLASMRDEHVAKIELLFASRETA